MRKERYVEYEHRRMMGAGKDHVRGSKPVIMCRFGRMGALKKIDFQKWFPFDFRPFVEGAERFRLSTY